MKREDPKQSDNQIVVSYERYSKEIEIKRVAHKSHLLSEQRLFNLLAPKTLCLPESIAPLS